MHCSIEYVKIAFTFFHTSSFFSFKHIQKIKTFITCQRLHNFTTFIVPEWECLILSVLICPVPAW